MVRFLITLLTLTALAWAGASMAIAGSGREGESGHEDGSGRENGSGREEESGREESGREGESGRKDEPEPKDGNRAKGKGSARPETTIVSGPRGSVDSLEQPVVARSDDPDAEFRCRLDGGQWKPCEAEHDVDDVGTGHHLLDVQAVASGGAADRTPAEWAWTAPARERGDDCDRFASPTGSDGGDGSAGNPLRSVQKLVDSLDPGDVGCLRQGSYRGAVAIRRGGSGDADRVTLRSAPGERAEIVGQLWVADDADFVTVSDLDLDGTAPASRPSPLINGDDVVFEYVDVSSDNGVCFYLGDREWGVARRATIRNSRIHDCGEVGTNHRHGFYVAQAVDTLIEGNLIFDNPDRGIQLYPNSRGAIIRGNVLDANGQNVDFSGDHGQASSGNVVEHNLITNSRLGSDVMSWYPKGNPAGRKNVVRGNCIHGGRDGEIQLDRRGFRADDNLIADPDYRDRSGRDFRVEDGSPCATALGGFGFVPR